MATPQKIGTLESVNYYSHRRLPWPGASASFPETKFFLGGTTSVTGEYNQLAVYGNVLPDDIQGHLTGVFIRHTSLLNPGAFDPSEAHTFLEMLNTMDVEVVVGGLVVYQRPAWACGGPVEAISGLSDAAATATGLAWVQSGSFMLAEIDHPVFTRQSIGIRLFPNVATASHNPLASTALTCTLQIRSSKALAS